MPGGPSADGVTSRRFWILHPGAELEWARPTALTWRETQRAQLEARRPQFAALTRGEASAFLDELPACRMEARGCSALLWAVTPETLKRARLAGLRLPQAPDCALIKVLNDKTRLEELNGEALIPGRLVARSRDEALKALRAASGCMRLKRPFGCAGRGQRRLSAQLTDDDRRFLDAALRAGPVVLEPELEAAELLCQHAMVGPRRVIFGQGLHQEVDSWGAPTGSFQASNAGTARALRRHAERITQQLLRRGYFGPFGIDVLLHQGELFVIDLNVRFTLGFGPGLGARRDEAVELLATDQLA